MTGHSLIKFLLKNLQKTQLLSESWVPGLDSHWHTPHFWEQSDGTFWAIAMKNLHKPSKTTLLPKTALWILDDFCDWPFLKRKPFSVNPGVPQIFGNDQMAHSGRLRRKMPKNLALLTKTGFRIAFANSFFKSLLKTFPKTILSVNPGVPRIFGTFDKNRIQDCGCQSFFV